MNPLTYWQRFFIAVTSLTAALWVSAGVKVWLGGGYLVRILVGGLVTGLVFLGLSLLAAAYRRRFGR